VYSRDTGRGNSREGGGPGEAKAALRGARARARAAQGSGAGRAERTGTLPCVCGSDPLNRESDLCVLAGHIL